MLSLYLEKVRDANARNGLSVAERPIRYIELTFPALRYTLNRGYTRIGKS